MITSQKLVDFGLKDPILEAGIILPANTNWSKPSQTGPNLLKFVKNLFKVKDVQIAF